MQRTKDHILRIFNQLLIQKSIENITVSMIIQAAGISRSTFYRYFQDKFDLMKYNYVHLINSVLKDNDCLSFKKLQIEILTFTKTYRDEMKQAFKTNGPDSFEHFIYEYSLNLVVISFQSFYGRSMSEEERLLASLHCHGGSGILNDWINQEYTLSIDQVAELLVSSVPDFIKKIIITPDLLHVPDQNKQ